MPVDAIRRFIATGDGDFETLARGAFRFQLERVEPVSRLAARHGVDADRLGSFRDVPLVPTGAFKRLTLAAAPAQEVFQSSGTSSSGPSRHHQPFPELYRQVIDASFPGFCLVAGGGGPLPMLSLVPSREQLPQSSLSFMVDHVLSRFGAPGTRHAFGTERVELAAARSWLGARQRSGQPSLVLATAFALVQLLEGLERLALRFRLPTGSVLFETGGYKGRSRELSRPELLQRVEERLGIPPRQVVTEYGMTELTSQCYSPYLQDPELPVDPREPPFLVAPPWVRVRILDAVTLEEVEPGGRGLIAVFDLANVGSALHLLTEDLGQREEGGFRLLGRAGGAELRGCSLAVEELAAG